MRTIHIVMGSTGEYSDRREFVVCAYTSKDAAKARVLALSTRSREIASYMQTKATADWEIGLDLVRAEGIDGWDEPDATFWVAETQLVEVG